MTRWTERFAVAGKRALVTGAAGGIGSVICQVLADAGADIAAVDRDAAGLDAVAHTVRGLGRRCETFAADLATVEGPRGAAKAALAAFGTVDILVNNAGIAVIEPTLDTDLDTWDRTMAINLRTPLILAQALAPGMIAQQAGKIVNISSQASVIAIEGHASYSASKAGLNALTRNMAAEWARHNVQVNAVCPTIIMTPLGKLVWGDRAKSQPMLDRTPLGRFGEPVEVADMVLYLASPASDLVNGATMLIDAGFSVI
ncbi:MAG: SDR family oxidoreductase [Alphaproteobacteria bacterium]